MPIPRPTELFDDRPLEQFELLRKAIANSVAEHDRWKASGEVSFIPKVGIVKSGFSGFMDAAARFGIPQEMLKALTPDLAKEWELGNPIAQTPIQYTGITPYNVEPAVLMIVPKELKLRNSVSRVKGEGQGLEYRRVTGVSNSTFANRQSPFFVSTANTQSFNGVTLNRPNQISYSADVYFKPYVEMGFSDFVSMQQQFAAQGFTDARALSSLALIWAHVLGEERALLNSRSTALAIGGASATVALDSTVTASGLPAAAITAAYVTFSSSFGESQAITATGTPTTSLNEGVKLSVLADVPVGTLAINIYLNYSGTYYKGSTVFTVEGAYGVGASPALFSTVTALPSTTADNGSYPNYEFGGTLIQGASSNSVVGYDGAVTEFSNPALAGYTQALNASLNADNPGIEFENALVTIYVEQGGDPDVIWTTGSIMQTLWTNIKADGGQSNYRVNLVTGDNGVTAGGAVTGIVNPSTGKVVSISTHRYMSPGVAVIHSLQVPWPDSNVSATIKVSNVTDTMIIDWPQIGMSYDQSTYTYGTAVFEAPIISGTITNIFD